MEGGSDQPVPEIELDAERHRTEPQRGPLRSGETVLCPTCGPSKSVWVNSHEQCTKCGRVLGGCCDGR